jgi:hypothetical protein
MARRKTQIVIAAFGGFLILACASAHAGPVWAPPGWPNGPLDPSRPPQKTCYKDERYCTQLLPDGHCKLWGSRRVLVQC